MASRASPATVWGVGAMPLPYHADHADRIVSLQWLPAFRAAPTLLSPLFGHYLRERPKQAGQGVSANVVDSQSGAVTRFQAGMALIATGAPQEDTVCGTFRGFRFWDSDPLGQHPLVGGGVSVNALLSGGGDGALQDLLRIAFDPVKVNTPRALLSALSAIPEALLLQIQTEEDQAQRCLLWNGGEKSAIHDHPVLSRLHSVYGKLAKRVAALPAVVSQVEALLRDPMPMVTLIHPCDHFGRCYPLNHFVAQLLLEVLGKRGGIRYLPKHKVTSVKALSGSAHTCGDPNACHGKSHEVEVTASSCGKSTGSSQLIGQFNVIALRHGPEKRVGRPPAVLPIRRQMVPYKLP